MTYVYDQTLQRFMVKDESLKATSEKNQNHDFLQTSWNGLCKDRKVSNRSAWFLVGHAIHNSHPPVRDTVSSLILADRARING